MQVLKGAEEYYCRRKVESKKYMQNVIWFQMKGFKRWKKKKKKNIRKKSNEDEEEIGRELLKSQGRGISKLELVPRRLGTSVQWSCVPNVSQLAGADRDLRSSKLK